MRYNKIEPCECVNGEDWGITVWIQGCPHHCEGCFNPETWDFEGGEHLTGAKEQEIYQLMAQPHIKRCSFSGGEPLMEDNLYHLNYMLCTIKSNWRNKKIWLWTGYTWDEIQERRTHYPDKLMVTFKYLDYLVTGPFIQEEKDLTLKWRGSRNQEVIDIQETRKQGKKVLYVE